MVSPALWFAAHKVPVLAGAGVSVVGLGLYTRNKSANTAAAAAATPVTASSYTSPQNAAAYDSSSSDVYNAIQPQIEQTQGLLQTLLDKLNGGGTTPPPTPTPANFLAYTRDSASGAIYGLDAYGSNTHLTPAEWARVSAGGAPSYTSYNSQGTATPGTYLAYTRDSSTGSIYGLDARGSNTHITPAEWARLSAGGAPKYTSYI